MAVMNPLPRAHSAATGKKESLNNLSVAIELTCGDQRMLFTGDLEREALARLTHSVIPGHITLVKVPHHGARSSLERDWLDRIRPHIAVVSAGRRNPYGHPAEEVLTAYRSVDAQVWRTDQDGAIWADLSLTRHQVAVHSTREWTLQPALSSESIWSIEENNLRRLWRRWNWN